MLTVSMFVFRKGGEAQGAAFAGVGACFFLLS